MKLQELEAVVTAMGKEMARLEEEHKAMRDVLTAQVDSLKKEFDVHRASYDDMAVKLETVDLESAHWGKTVTELCATVDEIKAKVEGRNKSAPVQRNMTDADALRVLNGDLKAMSHKEAGEAIGLTYAQVYSCRLGYTFKHVHRELEKAGWKCPWEKA